MDRADIKDRFRLYDLRHTFATRAAASDMNLPTLAAILGHANIQMTMRYVHPAVEEKRRAIHKFERFRAEAVINAAAAQRSHGVTIKVTTVERLN
jgi:integrase